MTEVQQRSVLALAACLALALAGAGEAARPQPRPGAGLPRAGPSGPSLGAEEAAALLERYGSLKGYHKALAFRHRAAHAEGCTQATGRPDCVSVTQGNETTYFESLAAFAGVPADEVAAWEALPASWDWRDHGVVSAAKDQGRCGSCWAFASAEAMESHWALASGHLEDLSIQQILDCTPNPQHCGGTGGCHGSIPQLAFAQIDEQGGLAGEWSYGYTSYSGKDAPECAFAPEKLHATSSARGKTATVQVSHRVPHGGGGWGAGCSDASHPDATKKKAAEQSGRAPHAGTGALRARPRERGRRLVAPLQGRCLGQVQ